MTASKTKAAPRDPSAALLLFVFDLIFKRQIAVVGQSRATLGVRFGGRRADRTRRIGAVRSCSVDAVSSVGVGFVVPFSGVETVESELVAVLSLMASVLSALAVVSVLDVVEVSVVASASTTASDDVASDDVASVVSVVETSGATVSPSAVASPVASGAVAGVGKVSAAGTSTTVKCRLSESRKQRRLWRH